MELLVHYADTEEIGEELEQRVAGVHADLVTGLLYSLPYSDRQLSELLRSILEDMKPKGSERKEATEY